MELYKGAIVYAVFQAIEGEGRLLVGEPVSLEYLARDQDGIFPNLASWRGFIYGNFGTGDGSYYLEGVPSESLIKRRCYPLEDYKGLFVQKLGSGKYAPVAAEDLEFTFQYDANNFRKGRADNLPETVEIYVTARVKE